MIETLNAEIKKNNIYLTLLNDSGETKKLSKIISWVHTNKSLKIRWTIDDELDNIYPYTAALIHTARRSLAIYYIRPVLPLTEGTDVEILIED